MRQTKHDKTTLTTHSAVLPFSPMCSTRSHVSDLSTKPNKVWGVLFVCLKAHVLATYFVTAQSGTNLALIPCWPSSEEPSQGNSQDEPTIEHGASCDAIRLANPNAADIEHPCQVWIEPELSIRVSAYLASTMAALRMERAQWMRNHFLNGRCRTVSFMMIQPVIRRGIRRRPDPISRQSHKKAAQARQCRARIMAVDHHVDHAVFLQELGPLESVGQVLPDRLLDHPSSGEPDQGPRLGHMDITQHRSIGRLLNFYQIMVESKLGLRVVEPMPGAASMPLHTALGLIREAQPARVRAHVRSTLLQVNKRPQLRLQKVAKAFMELLSSLKLGR